MYKEPPPSQILYAAVIFKAADANTAHHLLAKGMQQSISLRYAT
jgi:hypothetical protein